MAIDKSTVEYVAHLARIELTQGELETLSKQLHDIVAFIDAFKALDLKDIAPTSHILDIENVLRDDVPVPSLDRALVLKNAPRKSDAFFVVPKVIE